MNADEVVTTDLDSIVNQLADELPHLSGRNVLIAGGAGFLGHYLVQTALRWNTHNRSAPPITVTVLDNFVRDIPPWLTGLADDPNLRLLKHDVTQPLPGSIGRQHFLIHAASIASPIYYRKRPIETMDANVNGLRFMLDYCVAQKQPRRAG